MKAELHITQTSAGCIKYELRANGKRIWSNRVVPTDAGHQGARSRMAAWALRHNITVTERIPAAQRQLVTRAG